MGADRGQREDRVNRDGAAVPLVVALDMGYGHLRAAAALAAVAGTCVHEADRPPLADAAEQAQWARARSLYEGLSRGTDWPLVGPALRRVLDAVTRIPKLRSRGDLRPPNAAARMLRRQAAEGLGRGLVERLRASPQPLVATFYSPAVIAADAGVGRITLVVTDSDVNRVWVPADPARNRITYCVPAERAAARLARYGVPADDVLITGFPLPPALLGDPVLTAARENLASRLARLDPEGRFRRGAAGELSAAGVGPEARDARPPLLVAAVGGAGAQVGGALAVLHALAPRVREGRLRLALVAGVRADVAERFRAEGARLGLDPRAGAGFEVLCEGDWASYLPAFDALLARADVVWTKPSELTFYAALGLPLLLARPLGVHEKANRRHVLERRAAFDARTGRAVADRLAAGLADGSLAEAAWNGFLRMPKHGTWRILEAAARR